MWYHRWSERVEDPVPLSTKRIDWRRQVLPCRLFSGFHDRGASATTRSPPRFFQAAKWIFVDPIGDKHPTTMDADVSAEDAVSDRIHGHDALQCWPREIIIGNDEAELQRQLVATMSTLAGEPIRRPGHLVAATRRPKRHAPAAVQDEAPVAA